MHHYHSLHQIWIVVLAPLEYHTHKTTTLNAAALLSPLLILFIEGTFSPMHTGSASRLPLVEVNTKTDMSGAFCCWWPI